MGERKKKKGGKKNCNGLFILHAEMGWRFEISS